MNQETCSDLIFLKKIVSFVFYRIRTMSLWNLCVKKRARFFSLITYQLLLLASFLFILNPSAIAVPPLSLTNSEFSYQNTPASLQKVLEDFSYAFSLQPVIDNEISGEVTNNIRTATAIEFIDRLSKKYHLQWFVFDGKLYISSLKSRQSMKIKVPKENVETLKKALTEIGLLDKRFGWAELPDSAEILVSGPDRYVKLIQDFSQISEKEKTKPENKEVMFFPLHFSEASDREIKYRSEVIIIPGVGTVLKDLLNHSKSEPQSRQRYPDKVSNILNDNSYVKNRIESFFPDYSSLTIPMLSESRQADENDEKERVVVDTRNNAILIYGKSSRRDEYAQIIKKLDMPLKLISIDTLVVDIDRNLIIPAGGQGKESKRKNSLVEGVINGNKKIMTAEEMKRFQKELKYFSQRGVVSSISRSALITMENYPAILTFNPQGADKAKNNEAVSWGETFLQITPRVIASAEKNLFQVKLDIYYGNATQPATATKNLSGDISTLVAFNEADSLVVGGLSVHEENNLNVNLSEKTKRERFFIITPRSVYDHQSGQPVEKNATVNRLNKKNKERYSESTYKNIIKDIVRLSSYSDLSRAPHEDENISLQGVCDVGWPFSVISGNVKSLVDPRYTIFSSFIKNTGQQKAVFPTDNCDDAENLILFPSVDAEVFPGSIIEIYVVSASNDYDDA
ncbi:hypothetical protein EHW64_10295 [Erwinia psidii]|uniref:secretin N-terminal domain-containing protein n=1 Tax=Erwinia psidii TaxID=69224 RepID=UPI00226B42CB|nr:secretin N-terminal domain-containing protein [Erwinia psidii]MCX8961529.1 hypothetical protein [Erwinia psidii]